VVTIGKADITLGWGQIKSIDYAGPGSGEFRKAKASLDAGNAGETIAILEPARKQAGLRPVLLNQDLNLLGSAYRRDGKYDQAIEIYNELFKQFPKTQFLLPAGENLINCYLDKGNVPGANDALKLVMDGAKGAGIDVTPLNLLRGRVQEETGDFASAVSSYKTVLDSGADDAAKAAAELGIARCTLGMGKTTDAEMKFKALTSRDLPPLVLAGAWNGLGKIWYDAGAAKRDAEAITEALYAYLRGCVLYTPQSGEPTAEYEHAVRGSYDCFKAISEIEVKDTKKKDAFAKNARERLEHLQTKFPNSKYLPR
jgi:tetratricopeptide (TPR) repeat protein